MQEAGGTIQIKPIKEENLNMKGKEESKAMPVQNGLMSGIKNQKENKVGSAAVAGIGNGNGIKGNPPNYYKTKMQEQQQKRGTEFKKSAQ